MGLDSAKAHVFTACEYLTLVSPVDLVHFVPVPQDFFLLLRLSPGEAPPRPYPVTMLIKHQKSLMVHIQILYTLRLRYLN